MDTIREIDYDAIWQNKDGIVTDRFCRPINILKPDPTEWEVEHICYVLGRTGRFRNDTRGDLKGNDRHYSVAEHSHLLKNAYLQCGGDAYKALFYTVHDFSEFVTGDIPSPLLNACPELKQICHRFQECVWDHYCPGWDHRITTIELQLYKRLDSKIGRWEWEQLQFLDKRRTNKTFHAQKLHFWDAPSAEAQLLEDFNSLKGYWK